MIKNNALASKLRAMPILQHSRQAQQQVLSQNRRAVSCGNSSTGWWGDGVPLESGTTTTTAANTSAPGSLGDSERGGSEEVELKIATPRERRRGVVDVWDSREMKEVWTKVRVKGRKLREVAQKI